MGLPWIGAIAMHNLLIARKSAFNTATLNKDQVYQQIHSEKWPKIDWFGFMAPVRLFPSLQDPTVVL